MMASRWWTAGLLTVTLAACASGGAGSSGSAADGVYGADGAEAAASAFVEAARMKDYRAMSRLFGTADGPAERRLGQTEVERRMLVLASIMEHRSHRVRSSPLSEGPDRQRLMVDMTNTRSGDVSVPLIVVRSGERWFVEQVVTDPLTR